MFDMFNELEEFQNNVQLVGLMKKNNIDYEIEVQSKRLADNKNIIMNVVSNNEESIIIYRKMHDLEDDEEYFINIGLRIISIRGVVYPDPKLHAIIHDDRIHLTDIKIFGANQNKGYGIILVNKLKEIAMNREGIERIYGSLAFDSDEHLSRLKHFYNKCGFKMDGIKIEWNRDGHL